MGSRASCDPCEARLELRKRKVLQHLEASHQVEDLIGRHRVVESCDVGHEVGIAALVKVDGRHLHTDIFEIATKHARTQADFQCRARGKIKRGTSIATKKTEKAEAPAADEVAPTEAAKAGADQAKAARPNPDTGEVVESPGDPATEAAKAQATGDTSKVRKIESPEASPVDLLDTAGGPAG